MGFNYRLSEGNAAITLGQLERSTELVENRKKVAVMFDEVLSDQQILTKQHTPDDCINSYWCYSVLLNSERPELDWYKFRDLFQKNGGDGFYAAWKLSYFEPLFLSQIQNMSGVWQLFEDGLCPNAEYLQPRLIQFKTNYWNLDEAENQMRVLEKTLKEF
jgi:perosamine synthetase